MQSKVKRKDSMSPELRVVEEYMDEVSFRWHQFALPLALHIVFRLLFSIWFVRKAFFVFLVSSVSIGFAFGSLLLWESGALILELLERET